MTTFQLTATPQIVGDRLELGALSLRDADGSAIDRKVELDNRTLAIDLPEDGSLQIRLLGSTSASGGALAIEASSTFGTRTGERWTREGADAISPIFSEAGELGVTFGVAPDGGTQGAKITTVTVRITKGGKPGDDFLLANFPPR